MLIVVSLYSLFPSTSRKNPKIQKEQFFPILTLNSSKSLCFGGSSTRSNIVCLAMLVPQIQRICIIHMWRVSPFRTHCRQPA